MSPSGMVIVLSDELSITHLFFNKRKCVAVEVSDFLQENWEICWGFGFPTGKLGLDILSIHHFLSISAIKFLFTVLISNLAHNWLFLHESINFKLALDSGHWGLGTGHWSLGSGHWSLGTAHRHWAVEMLLQVAGSVQFHKTISHFLWKKLALHILKSIVLQSWQCNGFFSRFPRTFVYSRIDFVIVQTVSWIRCCLGR